MRVLGATDGSVPVSVGGEVAGGQLAGVARGRAALVARTWTLVGPLPDEGGDVLRGGATPVEAMLTEAGVELPFVATESMHCAARELARILALEGKLPGQRLERFLYGACGNATSFGGRARSLVGEVGEDVDDKELLAQWRDDIVSMVRRSAEGDSSVGGVALFRAQGAAAVVVTTYRRLFEVKPFSLVPDESGHLTLEGRAKSTRTRPSRRGRRPLTSSALSSRRC